MSWGRKFLISTFGQLRIAKALMSAFVYSFEFVDDADDDANVLPKSSATKCN